MRVLFATRGGSGHVQPLAPVARARLAAGHEVPVAARAVHGANVERLGLPPAAVAAPAEEDRLPMTAPRRDRARELAVRIGGGRRLRGVPPARVGLGPATVEELTVGIAGSVADGVRAESGLPSDPAGDRLRAVRYLTAMPEPLDPAGERLAPVVRRFRAPAPSAPSPRRDLGPGGAATRRSTSPSARRPPRRTCPASRPSPCGGRGARGRRRPAC